VPYLLLGLQDVQWAVENSRGARKLARTPHVNQKKKKKKNPSGLTHAVCLTFAPINAEELPMAPDLALI